MIFQYTFLNLATHPGMPSHPAHRCRQRKANLRGSHTSSSSSRSKSFAIQASCVKSFHLFIFSLNAARCLGIHASSASHTYILLTSRNLHTSCHTARQPNLSLAIIKKTSVRAMPFTPCRASLCTTSRQHTHSQPFKAASKNISHTHRVISHLRATYASTICSSFQSGWSSHIAA